MSEKELADLDKEFDSITAPTCPYKIQPHNQGGEMIPSYHNVNDHTLVSCISNSYNSDLSFTALYSISGKLIWLSGAPGLGKSTSAQILGREHGFVYYEADCFLHLKVEYWHTNIYS